MREFLIRRTDGEWFDLPHDKLLEILRPIRVCSRAIAGWGNHRIEVLGCELSFSLEDPGIQACFETGVVSEEQARLVASEVLESLTRATGQRGEIVEL